MEKESSPQKYFIVMVRELHTDKFLVGAKSREEAIEWVESGNAYWLNESEFERTFDNSEYEYIVEEITKERSDEIYHEKQEENNDI